MTGAAPDPLPYPTPSGNDDAHLRLLSIFHYVHGGLLALCGTGECLVTLWVASRTMTMPTGGPSGGPPPEMQFATQTLFAAAAVVYLVGGLVVLALELLAGRWLAQRRNRTFCFVVASLCCLLVPFGTILGIFTIFVLCRPSVAEAFARNARTA